VREANKKKKIKRINPAVFFGDMLIIEHIVFCMVIIKIERKLDLFIYLFIYLHIFKLKNLAKITLLMNHHHFDYYITKLKERKTKKIGLIFYSKKLYWTKFFCKFGEIFTIFFPY
jgi:hypothetical protein